MTSKHCAEGVRLEGSMDQAIQEQTNLQQADVDPNSPERQKAVAAAEKAEEAFRSHTQDCKECEAAAR
jgi:hypothetical protein